jgi:aryl-alcohol dehydrogenase
MTHVKAAVVREKSGPFTIDELELSAPRSDEVLVRIVGVGICHTDLVCRDQYFPVPLPCVLGHEGSGVVEQIGSDVAGLAPGDHVVLSYASCGVCSSCLQGLPSYCLDLYAHNFLGTRPDGSTALSQDGRPIHGHFFSQSSFATCAVAHARNTVKVPLGCGIQTGAGAVMNSLKPQAGSSIAVFGAGSVGLSAVVAARLVGCATSRG